jgi:Domain of unknown function (DUF932)
MLPLAAVSTQASPKVSPNYNFMPTYQIIDALKDEGFYVSGHQSARSRLPGGLAYAKHLIRMRHQNDIATDITPEVIIINSHNRSAALQIKAGAFRFVCQNGLMIGTTTGETGKIYHNAKHTMDHIIGTAIHLASTSRDRLGIVDTMKSVVLSKDDRHEFAYAARDLLPNPHLVDNVDELTYINRYEDKEDTVWHVYNRIQENVMRGNYMIKSLYKGLPMVRKARPVQNIDRNVQLNEKLWDLAVEFTQ